MKNVFNTKDITTPKEGLVVMENKYWMCEDGDPAKALFYGNHPQCNQNENVIKYALKEEASMNYAKGFKNLQSVFVKTAFVPQRED